MARKRKEITKKIARKRIRNPKPMKITALIVSAIQDLHEMKGSTPNKIVAYLSYSSTMPEARVKRKVKSVLRKGVKYGILRRYHGRYFLPTAEGTDRANRIAVRFASLPSPTLHTIRNRDVSFGKAVHLKDRKKSKRLDSKKQRRRNKRHVTPPVILFSRNSLQRSSDTINTEQVVQHNTLNEVS